MTGSLQAAALATALTAASCALPAHHARVSVSLNIAADANVRRPIPVDLVFVWDDALVAQLEAMTAGDWFGKKAALLQGDPTGKVLTVCGWEWVPGQDVSPVDLMVPASARRWVRAVYVFANYRSAGAHRARLEPGRAASLDLGRDDMNLRLADRATAPEYKELGQVDACRQTPAASPRSPL